MLNTSATNCSESTVDERYDSFTNLKDSYTTDNE